MSENGVTTVYNHGSNRILADRILSLTPEYELVTKFFEIRAGASLDWKNSVSSRMYPYACTQYLMTWNAGADVLLHLGKLDLGLMVGTGKGTVNEELAMVDETSGVQTSPFRLQDWYDRQMEYKTASRIDAGLSLRYNFR